MKTINSPVDNHQTATRNLSSTLPQGYADPPLDHMDKSLYEAKELLGVHINGTLEGRDWFLNNCIRNMHELAEIADLTDRRKLKDVITLLTVAANQAVN